jgi:formylglycine-generating enzyme required for sulfatase activity
MTFVRIEPGSFTMGSKKEQIELLLNKFRDINPDQLQNERPDHSMTIDRPFYLGAHEVTVGQFRRFVEQSKPKYKTEAQRDGKGGLGWDEQKKAFDQNLKFTWSDPGFHQTENHPVVNVSWNDAKAFIDWLNKNDGNGLRYRLPSEKEWEYACRAGTTTLFPNGDDPEKLALIGNVADASAKRKFRNAPFVIAADDGHLFTSPVGSYPPNGWRLFDMVGNVAEWCEDVFVAGAFMKKPPPVPPGAGADPSRVFRGGSWNNGPTACRPAFRDKHAPVVRRQDLGFRVAAGWSGQ